MNLRGSYLSVAIVRCFYAMISLFACSVPAVSFPQGLSGPRFTFAVLVMKLSREDSKEYALRLKIGHVKNLPATWPENPGRRFKSRRDHPKPAGGC